MTIKNEALRAYAHHLQRIESEVKAAEIAIPEKVYRDFLANEIDQDWNGRPIPLWAIVYELRNALEVNA